MKLPANIFRQYDIRGLVDKELTPAAARAVGQAYTTLATERLGKPPRVAVGRDNRPSGGSLAQGIAEGIAAAGGSALDVGEAPTPALYFATKTLPVDVKKEKAELGIAFDGDGDRIGAVDEKGEPVLGDQLLVLFGRDLVRRTGPSKPVIFDVKCSEVLPQMLKRAGLEPVMWKTGHSFIKQKMKEIGAPLAGEMSGHMFFGGDWYGFDDALFAAARLLAYVAREGGPLSRLLADLPKTYATPEMRVDCPDDEKFDVVQQAAEEFAAQYPISTLDGVRITFPEGWGLLRASNTQPVLVMRFEATSPKARDAYRAEVEGWLAARGVTA